MGSGGTIQEHVFDVVAVLVTAEGEESRVGAAQVLQYGFADDPGPVQDRVVVNGLFGNLIPNFEMVTFIGVPGQDICSSNNFFRRGREGGEYLR